MKVSVLIITYNQEEYITSAIKSALAQATNFDYEIIVGEDASTDRTREIVLNLQEQHPNKIRLLLRDAADSEHERAMGIGGKSNFIKGLQSCQGKYIALLDGDDYWTDVNKLQKQVDFLDSNPDFAISYHNAIMVFEAGDKEACNLIPANHKADSGLLDLLLVNFIPTCSAVFRRGLYGDLPDWFYTLKLGDWPLHLMNAQHGKLGYIDEVMAVYRRHEAGYWARKGEEDQALEIIKMLDCIDGYLDSAYKKEIRVAKTRWYYYLAQLSHGRGDRTKTRRFLRKYFWLRGRKGARELVNLFLRLKVPRLYKYLRSLKAVAGSDASGSPTT